MLGDIGGYFNALFKIGAFFVFMFLNPLYFTSILKRTYQVIKEQKMIPPKQSKEILPLKDANTFGS